MSLFIKTRTVVLPGCIYLEWIIWVFLLQLRLQKTTHTKLKRENTAVIRHFWNSFMSSSPSLIEESFCELSVKRKLNAVRNPCMLFWASYPLYTLFMFTRSISFNRCVNFSPKCNSFVFPTLLIDQQISKNQTTQAMGKFMLCKNNSNEELDL